MPFDVDRQIERLIDEASHGPLRVIVQTLPSDTKVAELIRTAAHAVRSRRSLISARDLVPPKLQELPRSKRPTPPGQEPDAATLAFTQSTRMRRVRTLQDAHQRGEQALKPLQAWGRQVMSGKQGSPAPDAAPVAFSASGSMAMTLTKDELKRLPGQVGNIASVVMNRHVGVPSVSRAKELPAAVTDNLGHTWGVARTGALACWGAYDARGQGVKVAVLDTGCDPRHPDLKGKLAGFAAFDSQGKIVSGALKDANDSDEHGTHCAGSVVGGNASGRWIGMAPQARILAGQVLPGGSGTDAQILGGMQWALDQGADVISLSLGGLRLSPDVLDTYTQMIITANLAGVPVVVSVGNEGSQTSGAPGNDYFAFTVGATDVVDVAAGFSGGRTQIVERSRYIDERDLPLVYSKPDVSAPGVDVYSTIPGDRYAAFSGTSMAAPHVAGAMALLLSALPRLRSLSGADRVNVLQQLLISTVKELGESGQNHRYGFGRIDVLRAVGFGKDLGY